MEMSRSLITKPPSTPFWAKRGRRSEVVLSWFFPLPGEMEHVESDFWKKLLLWGAADGMVGVLLLYFYPLLLLEFLLSVDNFWPGTHR